MNKSVYLFGKLSNEYTQYPDDYARNIFENFYANATSKTQIAVHRDNNLVYYGYIRGLDNTANESYIGLCIILNGVMIPDIELLFTAFEETIAYLATNGNILELSDKGNIISKVDKLYENQKEIEQAIEFINNTIERLKRTWQPLPPINYGIENSESKKFTISDDKKLISEAICKYRWIYIYKTENYNAQSLTDAINAINMGNQERLNKNELSFDEEHSMFTHLFSFKGRIRRTEYGLTIIIMIITGIIFSIICQGDSSLLQVFSVLYWLSLAQGAKRCHDIGKSGWWQCIPFYGFWLLFAKGDAGINKYGVSPK